MFEQQSIAGLEFLTYSDWYKEGMAHGFIGTELNFSEAFLSASAATVLNAFSAQKLVLPSQQHGTNYIVVDQEKRSSLLAQKTDSAILRIGEADALIIDKADAFNQKCVFGVRTADCMPLLARCGNCYALIHAGWRGMAGGIIEKVISALVLRAASRKVEVVLGPAAGEGVYQVGIEVVEAFGFRGVYSTDDSASEKFILSLSASAEKILKAIRGIEVKVVKSGICTISNQKYHSYRRVAGVAYGSNLNFVVC